MAYVCGRVCSRQGSVVRINPPCLEQGRELFRRFHCFPADQVMMRPCRRTVPRVLVRLGHLRGLIYSSNRGCGKVRTYIHFMRTPPLLTCDPQGTQLYVLGGRYRITRRGIEG